MSTLHLVDASIYIFRAYFSMPSSMKSSDGETVNGVYGFTQFLLDVLAHRPEFVSVAFDESLNTCYRNEIYPAYKANRDVPDDNMMFQVARCQEITKLLGFHHLSLKDFEADDIIGTVHRQLADGHRVEILTRDKDLGQLLRVDDVLWDFAADERQGPNEIEAKFNVTPAQLADYLALAGDSVDNIPGVPGVGGKTAAALLNRFGDLTSLLANIDDIDSIKASGIRGVDRVRRNILAHLDELKIYREITGINCQVPFTVELDDLRIRPSSLQPLMTFCDDMAFGNRVRDRISEFASSP
jgi:5'-3' exonuclease